LDASKRGSTQQQTSVIKSVVKLVKGRMGLFKGLKGVKVVELDGEEVCERQ
jgi:hypothetical protein